MAKAYCTVNKHMNVSLWVNWQYSECHLAFLQKQMSFAAEVNGGR